MPQADMAADASLPWERINYALIVAGTVLSFVGSIAVRVNPQVWTNDRIYSSPAFEEYLSSGAFDNVAVSSAVIVVPFLADALLDLYVWLKTPADERGVKSKVEHMSVSERLLFCAGMFIALIPRNSALAGNGRAVTDFFGYNSASAILGLCPIILFLCRVNKKVWTNFRAFFVVLCVVAASTIQAWQALYPEDSDAYNILTDASGAVMALALGIFTVNTAVQIVRLVFFRRAMRQRRKAHNDSSAVSSGGSDTDRDDNTMLSGDSGNMDDEVKGINFETAVAHMVNTWALLFINTFWYFWPGHGDNTTIFSMFSVAVACCVLIVEMRVRKKEITRGASQLDSKRAFVR